MTKPRVALETLGCKLNQYETDAIAAGLQALGWEVVPSDSDAEAYIVNTCTVTNKADRKSRNTLGHFVGRSPQPIVVVTGCYAESARERLEAQDGVTFVVPNGKKNQIPALVDAHRRGEVAAPELPPPDVFGFGTHERVFHTRASLKIQDGCDNFCTFCIIPSVRGRAVSRSLDEVLRAARELVAGGRKELVLTGVNMGRWRDGEADFTSLVAALLDLEGDFRLRITSLEPEGLGERFADLLQHPKMTPHLHLCLQSGSPRILLAMRREYTLDQYERLTTLLKSRRNDLNLTTDLIVGFPGESDQDFEQSLAVVRSLALGHVHVFPYSRRQDTRAERMPDQVPESIKAERSRLTQELSLELRLQAMQALIGQTRTVLVETLSPSESSTGLTEDYFPVRFAGQAGWNQWARVTLKAVSQRGGEPIFEAVLTESGAAVGLLREDLGEGL